METITELLVRCAQLESLNLQPAERESILAELQSTLDEVFGVLATLLAANPKWSPWAADSGHPGYLVRKADDLEIRAPWNLLHDFPPEAVLAELVSLVRRLRSGTDTVLCISGSSAAYGAVHPVGDVDFCEYVARTANEGEDRSFARTVRKAASLDDDRLLCIRLKTLSPEKAERGRPWGSSPGGDQGFLLKAKAATVGKCDFIGRTQVEGVLEITNLVLILDPVDPEAGAAQYSFPPQEVPVGEGSWVPRRLGEPLTLGRYVNWLCLEVDKQLSPDQGGSVAKAAKRALSLTRILFLNDQANQILKLLDEHALMRVSAIRARKELYAKIREATDPAVRAFEPALAETLRKLMGNSSEPVPDPGGNEPRVKLKAILAEITGLLTAGPLH